MSAAVGVERESARDTSRRRDDLPADEEETGHVADDVSKTMTLRKKDSERTSSSEKKRRCSDGDAVIDAVLGKRPKKKTQMKRKKQKHKKKKKKKSWQGADENDWKGSSGKK